MRKRLTRKAKNKRNKQIIIISSMCLLLVMVVGYAAFNTQLSITAKGNVKKVTADIGGLAVPVVTSGDGLYENEYDMRTYIYRGTNPDNYIEFNNELWRIITKEEDGTYKIVKNDVLPTSLAWNADNELNWMNSPIREYLNNDYYSSFTQFDKSQIVNSEWGIGPVYSLEFNYRDAYACEKSVTVPDNIGLLNVSDYLKVNSNQEECGIILYVYDYFNDEFNNSCSSTNWLSIDGTRWCLLNSMLEPTINSLNSEISTESDDLEWRPSYTSNSEPGPEPEPEPEAQIPIWGVTPNSINDTFYVTSPSYFIRPAVYLSSNITLSGSGTESDPYIIN